MDELGKPLKKVNPVLKEFKAFAMRGNVIDLAVGVIIGGAFGKIVSSIVNDIVMPAIGPLTGKINFKDRFVAMNGQVYPTIEEAKKHTSVVTYGNFFQTVIEFIIVALVIFLLVRFINRLQPKPLPAAPVMPSTRECPFCISTISLKATRCPQCTSPIGASPMP
ncbi:MAG: large conductance mechanosensitive channel protein MscL [Verrucomicrobiota bacterium]